MRMGHKGCGVRALRFVICVVAALAVAIALAQKHASRPAASERLVW